MTSDAPLPTPAAQPPDDLPHQPDLRGQPDLRDHRIDYHGDLLPDQVSALDPWQLFADWLVVAGQEQQAGRLAEPAAMVISTAVVSQGLARPSSRVVLLKEWDRAGLVFYTNQLSRKGSELAENPWASALWWWPSLMRQIRVEGAVEPVSRTEAEDYFAVRPRGSQVGAWASHQSQPLASREELAEAVTQAEQRFADGEVPCPPSWGGYRLRPSRFEFWQGQPSRLHERVESVWIDGAWQSTRLYP